jgi:hypothetical protein
MSAFERHLRLSVCRSKITVGGPVRNGVARRPCSVHTPSLEVPMDNRHPFRSHRIIRHAMVLAAAGTLAACAEPSAPARAPSSSPIIIIGGHPVVFNAQLRGVGNPDIKPGTAVEGHLQLKVFDTDAGLVASWRAVLVNPECESSLTFGGGIYAIQDSEDFPNPEDEARYDLFPPLTTLGCGESILEGGGAIADALVELLVEEPDDFIAVFFLNGGGALAGTFELGAPDTSPTR